MTTTVVGMGKIGLPLAVQFCLKGERVIGADINAETVNMINAGKEPFPGESRLQELLQQVTGKGLLSATLDTPEAVQQSQVVVVVVPLFVDDEGNPNFNTMDSAVEEVGKGLKAGTLVTFETTLPVGTTRNRLVPMLERFSGLKAGSEFHVVFSPERVLTGRVFKDLRTYPKLVGGIDSESSHRGIEFYSSVLDFDDRPDLRTPNGVWNLGTAEAAELAKLAETTYRDVNIALANEFGLFAERNGIDFGLVAEACNSQPYSHIHSPGIAVGGHCIPIYPQLYLANDPEATVVKAARARNAFMPEAVVERLERRVGNLQALKTVVLGAAYRGGVKETAFSGVFDVVRALEDRGADVRVHDPMFSDDELHELGLRPYHRGESAEVVVIQADHEEYASWGPQDIPGVRFLMDGRDVVRSQDWEPDVTVLTIGKSSPTSP